jgi:hypothetical protein
MSEKKTTGGRLIKTGRNMNRHRDGFQGVRCGVVTSRGSGSGARVRIFGRRRGEAMENKKIVLE